MLYHFISSNDHIISIEDSGYIYPFFYYLIKVHEINFQKNPYQNKQVKINISYQCRKDSTKFYVGY